MGADGHIFIWSTVKVFASWPDADNLFRYIPNHYRHELDGIKYDHIYWDTETDWECFEIESLRWFREWDQCNHGPRTKPEPPDEEFVSFLKWLEANATEWEVWT